MNGLSHRYHLGESTFIFRGIRSKVFISISLFNEILASKRGGILFAYVP